MATSARSLRGSLWGQPLLSVVQNHLISYPTPSNLSGNWNWGVLAGLCLVLQIATGIFLAMHYTAHVYLAFHSVQHIMRDVSNGWLLRYLHANGASLFFIVSHYSNKSFFLFTPPVRPSVSNPLLCNNLYHNNLCTYSCKHQHQQRGTRLFPMSSRKTGR